MKLPTSTSKPISPVCKKQTVYTNEQLVRFLWMNEPSGRQFAKQIDVVVKKPPALANRDTYGSALDANVNSRDPIGIRLDRRNRIAT